MTKESPSDTSQESHSRGRDSLLWELTSSPLKIPLNAGEFGGGRMFPDARGMMTAEQSLCALARRETSARRIWAEQGCNFLITTASIASSGFQGIDERREQ